jgi:plastocyanin
MDTETVFYVAAGALVFIALATSAIGLRARDFPSPGAFRAGAVLFLALVGVTAAFATLNARDEQEKRRTELASEEHKAGEGQTEGVKPAAPQESESQPAAGGATVKFATPPGAELRFTESQLSAPAGEDTIVFDNVQEVGHDVAIAKGEQVLGKTPLAVKGTAQASVKLEPGDYVFYCTVPGHREAGMEGKLTVK